MSNERSSETYIQDILTAIRKIEKFSKGLSYSNFLSDEKTHDAIIRNMEIIGEACSNLSKLLPKDKIHFPLHQIVSMRNKLIHEYFGVDPEIVWKTIQEKIPELKKEIKSIRLM